MKNLLDKPFLISWLAVPTLVLVGLLCHQYTLNIQLQDTYYVIANLHFAIAGALFLLVVGLGYRLLDLSGKTPNLLLALIHLSLTISVLVVSTLPLYNDDSLASAEWLFLMILAFLVAQCVYAMNIIITLLKRQPSK